MKGQNLPDVDSYRRPRTNLVRSGVDKSDEILLVADGNSLPIRRPRDVNVLALRKHKSLFSCHSDYISCRYLLNKITRFSQNQRQYDVRIHVIWFILKHRSKKKKKIKARIRLWSGSRYEYRVADPDPHCFRKRIRNTLIYTLGVTF